MIRAERSCTEALVHVVNECVEYAQVIEPSVPFARLYTTILVGAFVLVLWTAIDYSRGRR